MECQLSNYTMTLWFVHVIKCFKNTVKNSDERKEFIFKTMQNILLFTNFTFLFFFRKFLHRVDINGGEAEPLEIPAGGSGRMYGLVSLPSYCPSGK